MKNRKKKRKMKKNENSKINQPEEQENATTKIIKKVS